MFPTEPDPIPYKLKDAFDYFKDTKKKQLAASLRGDVSLYLLTEKVYLATRRGALPELPGILHTTPYYFKLLLTIPNYTVIQGMSYYFVYNILNHTILLEYSA